jgi:hypothetical protein
VVPIIQGMKQLILAIIVGCIFIAPLALHATDAKATATASCCDEAKGGCSDAKSTCTMSAKEMKAAQKAAKKAEKKAAKQAAKEAAKTQN